MDLAAQTELCLVSIEYHMVYWPQEVWEQS